jgi:hypothetical protein
MLTEKWDSLIHSTNDTQGAGMLSLNRARRDNKLFLLHENQIDPIFKKEPHLLEFKKEGKVEDISREKN